MDQIDGGPKRKYKKKKANNHERESHNAVSKSLANMNNTLNKKAHRKRRHERQPFEYETKQVVHKVNCAAWGCKCQEKGQKKKDLPRKMMEPDYSKELKVPYHPKLEKIKTMYPNLYKWDLKQQYRLKMGQITKEEY